MSVSALTGHTSVMEAKQLGFFGFSGFSEKVDFGNFPVGFGVWRVCNRWEMAVGFKYTDSHLISCHMGLFSTIFKISLILLLFPIVPGRSHDPSIWVKTHQSGKSLVFGQKPSSLVKAQ